jgi:hypothetical protein
MSNNNKNRKHQLIEDIQNLLNTYNDNKNTTIDPNLLEFMDEDTLVNIIESLFVQKEEVINDNSKWLEKFKKTIP